MLFNSIDFAIFLPIVFYLYWFVFKHSIKGQNFVILAASYLFYGWWDWKFLSLIIFSTILDFNIGKKLGKETNQRKRKHLLWLSMAVNLGLLGFFKYFNFFIDNFSSAFSLFGSNITFDSLDIVLPVGISFYTFQTMSYTIDIYRNKLKPSEDVISFCAFVSFFPQLVAGPIERATNLLPQFYNQRQFDYSKAVDGMRQILWGLFMKIVIADQCAKYANIIFDNYSDYPASSLLLGGVFFTIQIYGDFSGYSHIAIGTSRLFGFNLMKNFNFPFLSRDIAEFWRRWHISLSTWFRDYVYIPLGGSKVSKLIQVRNTFIIFIISGFWHGANWTFMAWGAINAIYFLPLLLRDNNRKNIEIVGMHKKLPSLKELFLISNTFLLTVIGFIIFRSVNITEAFDYIYRLFSSSIIEQPFIVEAETGNMFLPKKTLAFILLVFILEWLGRRGNHPLETIVKIGFKPLRIFLYILMLFSIFLFGGEEQMFIYFQF